MLVQLRNTLVDGCKAIKDGRIRISDTREGGGTCDYTPSQNKASKGFRKLLPNTAEYSDYISFFLSNIASCNVQL